MRVIDYKAVALAGDHRIDGHISQPEIEARIKKLIELGYQPRGEPFVARDVPYQVFVLEA